MKFDQFRLQKYSKQNKTSNKQYRIDNNILYLFIYINLLDYNQYMQNFSEQRYLLKCLIQQHRKIPKISINFQNIYNLYQKVLNIIRKISLIPIFALIFSSFAVNNFAHAIPINFKIAMLGGKLKDNSKIANSFGAAWSVPAPDSGLIDIDKKLRSRQWVTAQIEANKKDEFVSFQSEQIKKKYEQYSDTGNIILVELGGKIRYDDWVFALNIGFLELFSNLKMEKQITEPTLGEKIKEVETAKKNNGEIQENIKKSDNDKENKGLAKNAKDLFNSVLSNTFIQNKFKDYDKTLDTELQKLKDEKSKFVGTEIAKSYKNSIEIKSNRIFFTGPAIGYYINQLSVVLLFNVAIKKTEVEIIDNMQADEKKTQIQDLGYSIGIMPGVKIGYDINDYLQIFVEYAAFVFFDNLLHDLKNKTHVQQQAKPKDPKDKVGAKGPDNAEPEDEPIMHNGTKHMLGIGLMVRFN